jgi:hypothetical protein
MTILEALGDLQLFGSAFSGSIWRTWFGTTEVR